MRNHLLFNLTMHRCMVMRRNHTQIYTILSSNHDTLLGINTHSDQFRMINNPHTPEAGLTFDLPAGPNHTSHNAELMRGHCEHLITRAAEVTQSVSGDDCDHSNAELQQRHKPRF